MAERRSQESDEEREGGPELGPHQVLLRPIITEKGTHLVERRNTYSFRVNPLANKEQIRDAVQRLFEVRVVSVRTQNRKGKKRRHKMRMGRKSNWKKAIVTLSANDRIALF